MQSLLMNFTDIKFKPVMAFEWLRQLKKAIAKVDYSALLDLKDLKPVARSSLLALGYEAAEADFIWETLQHDLGASHANKLVFIQQEQPTHG